MADRQLDPDIALAELGLERLDDVVATGTRADDGEPEMVSLDAADDVRLADEDAGRYQELRDPYADTHAYEDVTEAIDAFDDAFNARDLDAVMDIVAEDVECPGLGNDRDNLPEAIEDLWERRPNSLLTRGWLDDRCCSVLWDPATTGGWWRVAIVHFDDVDDGVIGVVELNDDPVALDEVETDGPDGDVEEGTRWEEWADGEAD